MIKRNDGISKDDICQNQFTAYVVLAVKRKRQSYIKKKQRDNEKENRTKKEAEQSEFRTAGYDMWSRMEPQNEKLMAAMQQLSLKERFNPILNILIVTRGIIHVYTSAMRMLCRCDASAAKKLSGQCIRRNLDSFAYRHYNAKKSEEKEASFLWITGYCRYKTEVAASTALPALNTCCYKWWMNMTLRGWSGKLKLYVGKPRIHFCW